MNTLYNDIQGHTKGRFFALELLLRRVSCGEGMQREKCGEYMDEKRDNDEKALMLYTTIGGLADAEKLGDELVNRGLAACVNIIPGVLSIYESEGRNIHDHEAIMIIKSRENLRTRLLDGIKQLHPYELPAIIVIEPDECDAAYMDWIRLRTSKKGKGVN